MRTCQDIVHDELDLLLEDQVVLFRGRDALLGALPQRAPQLLLLQRRLLRPGRRLCVVFLLRPAARTTLQLGSACAAMLRLHVARRQVSLGR